MIVQAFFDAQFFFVNFLISLLPDISFDVLNPSNTFNILKYALYWFPLDLWILILTNIVFWITVQFSWAIIEWIYKKIPGIN